MVRYGPDDDKEAKEIHTENNKEENQTKTETNPEEINNKFDQQRKQDDLDESKSDNNDENIDEKLKCKQTKNISDLKGNKNDDQIDNLLRKQDKLENQIKKLKIMFMFFTIFLLLLASMLLVSYNNFQSRIASLEEMILSKNNADKVDKENIPNLINNSTMRQIDEAKDDLISYNELTSYLMKKGVIKIFDKNTNLTLGPFSPGTYSNEFFFQLFENKRQIPELNTIEFSFENNSNTDKCLVLRTLMPIKLKHLIVRYFDPTNCILDIIPRATKSITISNSDVNSNTFIYLMRNISYLQTINFDDCHFEGYIGRKNLIIESSAKTKKLRINSDFTKEEYGILYYHEGTRVEPIIKMIGNYSLGAYFDSIEIFKTHNTERINTPTIRWRIFRDLMKENKLDHINISFKQN